MMCRMKDAAGTANDLNHPDRSRDPYEHLEDNDIPDTVNSTGERVLQCLSYSRLLQKLSSITLPRSYCTCISLV